MGDLTEQLIVDLAQEIDVADMEMLALRQFGFSDAVLKNLKRKSSAEEINREILRSWSYKNPDDQVPNLALLLYSAPEKNININPKKVKEILKMSKEEAKKALAGAATEVDRTKAIDAWWEKVEGALASCVTNETELRNLGTNGFQVRRNIIDAALNNKKGDIIQAAAEVIKQWGLDYDDKEKAFDDLCEILQNIQRRAWIGELRKVQK